MPAIYDLASTWTAAQDQENDKQAIKVTNVCLQLQGQDLKQKPTG